MGSFFFGIFFVFFCFCFLINPLTAERALRALIDFTLSNARRFYSSMGNLLDGKGLNAISSNSTYLISVKSLNKDASLLFDFEKTRANMLISIKNNFWLRQELIDPSRQIDSNKDKNGYFELKAIHPFRPN